MKNNRYTVAENVPIGDYTSTGLPGGTAYMDPSMTAENGYADSAVDAWAPKLRQIPGETPDPHRTQQVVQYDYRPTPLTSAPELWWLGRGPGGEKQHRHTSAEYVDADGWEQSRPLDPNTKRAAPDPRRSPPAETRLTQGMSPSRYTFTRPFDQHAARKLNGIHFSMADHRREYPIMGMQPITRPRNTYRIDPTPWDSDIVDEPPIGQQSQYSGRVQQLELPPSGNRAWRLV